MPFSYKRRNFLCIMIIPSRWYGEAERKEDDRLWFLLGRAYSDYFNSSLSWRHELRSGFIYVEVTLSRTDDLWVLVRTFHVLSKLNHWEKRITENFLFRCNSLCSVYPHTWYTVYVGCTYTFYIDFLVVKWPTLGNCLYFILDNLCFSFM